MPDLKILVSGETKVNLPPSAKLTHDSELSVRELSVGFSNCDLSIGPIHVQHKSVKELMQTIAGIKQSLDQVGAAAMSLVKQNA